MINKFNNILRHKRAQKIYIFIVFIITALILSNISFLMFVITYIAAYNYLGEMVKARVTHMDKFYGNRPSAKNNLKTKLKIHLHFGLLALSGLILVCPFKYHPQVIILSFSMFLLILFGTKHYFKEKDIDLPVNLRKYYFKFSIAVGLIYSFFMFIFVNNTAILSSGKDAIANGSMCGLVVFLNDFTQGFADIMPPPLDSLFGIIFSLQVASGFVFTLYTIVFIQLNKKV